jgi:hypothetical protein
MWGARPLRIASLVLAIVLIASLILTTGAAPNTAALAPLTAPPEGFAHKAIADLWTRDDGPVASGRASRPWMWGPGPFYTQYEPYVDGPEGNHLVQYFDKGRLEINDPSADAASQWFVTSGLLVKEMLAGRAQVGDEANTEIGPARVALVGDDPAGKPHYADMRATAISDRASDRTGKSVGCLFGLNSLPDEVNKPLSRFEQASGHNWAEPFWRYASSRFGDRWLYILGYPVTEPCAVSTTIGGVRRNVLVQLFERRALTYNPANPEATQVEMGNVGRHYFRWRYENLHEASLEAHYNVTVSVGPAPSRATGVEMSVAFTNSTGQLLTRSVLRSIWHNWPSVLEVSGVEVDGKAAQMRWIAGVNLEVRPPSPIAPGARATIKLRAQAKPRPVGGRNGYDRNNDILSLGDLLPTLVPWENGGWLYYPYSELGDHGFYASARYNVTVKSANGEKLVVGGTGDLTSVNDGWSEWRFTAENARDVAYIVSPRLVDPRVDASMTRTSAGARFYGYFTQGNRAYGARQLEITAPALAWFSQKVGQYPYASYTVGEMGVPQLRTDNYAQEYPGVYLMPSQWLPLGTTPPSWTWYIPVHEVAHQWFYSIIGSNQLSDPWLDEAITTYMTAEYVRATAPQHYRAAWASMTGSPDRTRPVSAGVFSGFRSEQQYSATIYDGGSLMLRQIHTAMGEESFYAALREYFAEFKHKRATPLGFLKTLQKHSAADLQPIFAEYLGY